MYNLPSELSANVSDLVKSRLDAKVYDKDPC